MPRSPKRYLLSYLTTKILCACIFSPIRATCPVHLTFFDLITLIMFGKEQKAQSLSLCSFLQSPVKLATFEALISPSSILSQTLHHSAFTPARKNSTFITIFFFLIFFYFLKIAEVWNCLSRGVSVICFLRSTNFEFSYQTMCYTVPLHNNLDSF